MRRYAFLSAGVVFALVVSCCPSTAYAQGLAPRAAPGYRTPPVSPFLNLLRQGSDPAINYYGIVRPEIEFRNSLQGLQQQVDTVGAQTGNEGPLVNGLPVTGHPVQFFNYGHYFPARGTGGFFGGTNRTGIAGPTGATSPFASRTPMRGGFQAPSGPRPVGR